MPRKSLQVLLSVPPLVLAAASSLSAADAPRLVPRAGAMLTYRFTISTERSGGPTVSAGGISALMIGASTGSSATGTRRPLAGLMPKPPGGCPAGSRITVMTDYCSMWFPAEVASKAQAESRYTLSYFIPTAIVIATPQVDLAESAAQKTAVFKDSDIVVSNFLDCGPSALQKFMPPGTMDALDLDCERRTGFSMNGQQKENPAQPTHMHLAYRGKTTTATPAGEFETHVIDMDETMASQEWHASFYFSDTIGATVRYTQKVAGKDMKYTVSSESELLKYEE
jgi:hypothetical protein